MSEMDDCIIVKTEKTESGCFQISARTRIECNTILNEYVPPEHIRISEKRLRSYIENRMVEIVLDYLKPPSGTLRAYGFDIVGVGAIKDNTIYVPMKYAIDIYNIVNHMYDLENENKELRKLLGMV